MFTLLQLAQAIFFQANVIGMVHIVHAIDFMAVIQQEFSHARANETGDACEKIGAH